MNRIMTAGVLDDITGRLICCSALLDALFDAMGDNRMVDPLSGVHDLLESICRDFQTAIDNARKEASR